ncbi:MAG: 23S rRNA (adenine(2503)-C(2))-methyltransferase RlmN, partial [Acidimicrobiales bacterium]
MGRYDLSPSEVAALLDKEPAYRSEQVWAGLYTRACEPGEMYELPLSLRARLKSEPALAPGLRLASESRADKGETVRWVWVCHDGTRIESVLMLYPERATVCVSSQAGCAMGCGFCATGQGGFNRHLSTGEIVEQVVKARSAAQAAGRRLSNVVFMGMGEPMANYARVWAAVERIHADLGIGARHVTISTVGLVPGIRRLAAEHLPVGLAVSLHAANDALRDRLVPINRRWPIAEVVAACRDYIQATGRRLSFEWALIDGVNDSPRDAAELGKLAFGLRAHVNLIPLNPTPGWPTKGTPPAGVRAFADALQTLGVNATIRQTRGQAIDAACGQLAGAPAPPGALVPR